MKLPRIAGDQGQPASQTERAMRLCEREGFAHEGRRRGAVMVGDEAVDMLMMGKGI